MKILILGPDQSKNYNRGHQLFRDEIARQEEVIFYGPGYKGYDPERLNLSDILLGLWIELDFRPDLIMTYGLKYSRPFVGLGESEDIFKVHVVVDYHPWREEQQDEFLKRNNYDLIFSRTSYAARALERKGFKVYVLPFSVDTEVFKNDGVEKKYEVSAILSEPVRKDLYPYRASVKRLIESLNVGAVFTGNVYFDEYVQTINQTKIAVTSVSKFKWLPMQYTEILSCGTFLLADWAEDLDLVGLKDAEHFVLYDGLNDLKQKIQYYLKHDGQREYIAKQGEKFVRKFHGNKRRVETFLDVIKDDLF